MSCLVPVNYAREESQMPSLRSSNNLIRKWNPASVQDNKCQISEELEHRIGMIETSIHRFGMILDSVQGDIMQVNKGTKEVLLEMESIRQKLLIHDTSLQLMVISPCRAIKIFSNFFLDSSSPVPQKVCAHENQAPKIETGGWKSVKSGKATVKEKASHDEHKRKDASLIKQTKDKRLQRIEFFVTVCLCCIINNGE
ncbi:protein PAIR1 isoform X1 [Tripterygium wilfordii]|uniref:Protein PAIR1 isoform X1 n=1 Tax=Tripterygium wilfordii TaxID=458696 RepID=A0A7J7CCY4_TRIWF|nr:protein PAIR1 isoform X1 [Tripterygium wilfordii]